MCALLHMQLYNMLNTQKVHFMKSGHFNYIQKFFVHYMIPCVFQVIVFMPLVGKCIISSLSIYMLVINSKSLLFSLDLYKLYPSCRKQK